ncbi:MAG: SRPBCC family protein, partial [Saccharolobus sp.]
QERQNGEDGEVPIYKMKTIFSGKINKDELEKYLEMAMAKSVNSTVVVILSDERNIVEIKFKGGDLVSQKGEVESLSSPITILIKQ